jgi:hypothetical protein
VPGDDQLVGGRIGIRSAGIAVMAARSALRRPEIDAANGVAASALRLARTAAGIMAEVVPGAARGEWRELANKLHAFEWFTFAGARLGGPALGPAALARQVPRVAALADTYTGLWAMEGLGYACARAGPEAWPPRELLAGGAGSSLGGLPEQAMVPLSTGSALAAAERLLAEIARVAEGADRDRVRRWLEQLAGDAGPGARELATEALGLVARTLDPWRLGRLDALLAAIDPVLAEYLWHGVGRGLYFTPMNLPPWTGGTCRAFGKAWTEPPHDAGRRNATAGLAWAMTLVNVRSPEVAAASLAGHGEGAGAAAAVANGASSALIVWRQWAGSDALLARFLGYRPPGGSGTIGARRWRRIVDRCEAALSGPPLDPGCRGDSLAALFRFHEA